MADGKQLSESERRVAAVVGAFVGDAAALGSHWLYAVPVADVFGEEPEFAEPRAENYVSASGERTGYFAHAKKSAGDATHTGQGALLTLRQLVANGGVDLDKYAAAYQEEFGYGGDWVGYVDHAMKSTLGSLARPRADGEEAAPHGSVDEEQSNGLVATTPLGALLAGRPGADEAVDRSVRFVQNNDLSVEYVRVVHGILRRVAVDGASPRDATLAELEARAKGAHPKVDERLALAVERAAVSDDTTAATAEWGKSCMLANVVPSAVHVLLTARDFTDAVRKALLAGGDNASRVVPVAAVFAAAYGVGTEKGVPAAWVAKTRVAAEARKLAEEWEASQQR